MLLVVVIVASGALTPVAALAQGHATGTSFRHHGRSLGRSGSVHRSAPFLSRSSLFPPPADPWKHWPPGAARRNHHGRSAPSHGGGVPFSTFGVPSAIAVTGPVVVETYASPVTSVAVPAPPAMPAMPTVVDFPTGWYELRGDGVSTPYTWVWIPRPPPAPPAQPEPVAVPGAPEPAPTAVASEAANRDRGAAYHWTDERGVTTWTNRLDRVPKRFRDQAAASAEPD